MHILIDLQGAQTSGSRHRGIGNYSEALAVTVARLAQGKHRVSLLLNAGFAHTIDPIRATFAPFVPAQDIRVWQPLTPTAAASSDNLWRRKASEGLYASLVRSLRPDVLLVSSLFEGYGDDAVVALPEGVDAPLSAVVLYDLIPYLYPKPYLEDPAISAWYHGCLTQARRADVLLAISASSAHEAIDHLGSEPARAVNISSAIDKRFRVLDLTPERVAHVRTRYGLQRPFVMYTGGIDHRKNIEGLIAAYSALPKALRAQHQLTVVCSIQEADRTRLSGLARQKGLAKDELVLTGFVPDDDLVALYNLCHLFAFPSWHEGFGLPALEAMACGAPTLASNRSSLPEVVGCDEALFDPFDVHAMALLIERGLTDESFRARLKAHGLVQAKKFSWEATATRALEALERLHADRSTNQYAESGTDVLACAARRSRPRLAYVSPMPSAKSGIADYSAELLPVLAEYYDIDVIVEQPEPLTDPWVSGNLPARSVIWFEQHAHRFDRILYHFGNSSYHQHMFTLLERYPGAVVMHDFYLSGILAHMDATGYAPGAWARSLLHSHGWEALRHRFREEDASEVVWRWPCNLEVLQRALGVIVHSDFSRRLAGIWYGQGFADDWAVIPLLRSPSGTQLRRDARRTLGLAEEDILVCAFGLLGETKLNHVLADAWLASCLSRDPHCRLVFVGQESGPYGESILRQIRAGHGRIRITGWVDADTYRTYLAATDIAVQLRNRSRGETSAAVLDCMNHGLPTVVNAHGSAAELPRAAVWMLDDEFTTEALVNALEALLVDPERRAALGDHARAYVRAHHQPRSCATAYAQAIEGLYARAEQGLLGLARGLQRIGPPADARDLERFAVRAVELIPPNRPAERQLLIDISELHHGDATTGVQRVVRNVLKPLLEAPPQGFRVEPVYATPEYGYRYARQFTARFLGLGDVPLDDAPILAGAGDVFWGLDLQPVVVPVQQSNLAWMRLRGVKVVFTVYDLLPVLLPDNFVSGAEEGHRHWLDALANVADGLLSISAKVSGDLKAWLTRHGPQEGRPIQLGWAHLGADGMEPTDERSRRLTSSEEELLAAIRRAPAFLMVGTVEPGKGYAQALTAFDVLWSRGVRVSLVIVGKQGWLVDELVARLRSHPMSQRHLFWLESIDDAMLEQVYRACSCLLAASLDEGYGLPLVEAARCRLPILARDIAVFREVAGEYATYFDGLTGQTMAEAISSWLEHKKNGTYIRTDQMPWMDWAQATRAMLDVILCNRWQDAWTPARDIGKRL